VVGVEGDFQRGDAVELRTPDGRAFARGLAAYGAYELRRIRGKRTDEIERRRHAYDPPAELTRLDRVEVGPSTP